MDWSGLLRGELRLTFDILAGLAVGMLVLRSGLADKLMKRLLPLLRRAGIGPVLGMALTISLGSAKAGAAFIASALSPVKRGVVCSRAISFMADTGIRGGAGAVCCPCNGNFPSIIVE